MVTMVKITISKAKNKRKSIILGFVCDNAHSQEPTKRSATIAEFYQFIYVFERKRQELDLIKIHLEYS